MPQLNNIVSIISMIFGLLSLIVVMFLPFILLAVVFGKHKPTTKDKPLYNYLPKSHIMTRREEDFFEMLCKIFGDKCYVVPQVHLSSLLDHRVKGQNWKSAFYHINGKSIDYVLLRRRDLSVLCAVELDDVTHDTKDRTNRDTEVERIFNSVNIPLVRLRFPERMTKQEIVDVFADIIKSKS